MSLMNKKMKEQIELLLTKYFEGRTTLEEEEKLKIYFSSEEIEEELKPLQSLFDYIREQKSIEYPIKTQQKREKEKRGLYRIAVAGAAMLLLLLGSLFFLRRQESFSTQSFAYIHGELVLDQKVIDQYTIQFTEETFLLIEESKTIMKEQRELMKELGISLP